MVGTIEVLAIDYLHDVVEFFNGTKEILPFETHASNLFSRNPPLPLRFQRGQRSESGKKGDGGCGQRKS